MIVLALVGCVDDGGRAGDPDRLRVEGDALTRSSVPLFGGVVAQSDAWVAASDVDADRIVLRSIMSEQHVVSLPDGWVPGPLAFGEDGVLHVVLRGKGALLSVFPGDPFPDGAGPRLVSDLPVCADPRGLAVDGGRVWVACAGGELVGVGDGPSVVWQLDPDLRDIVILPDGRALVSRFRSAEVLLVDLGEGVVEDRFTPEPGVESTPRVGRRLVPWNSTAVLLYQRHFAGQVRTTTSGGYSGDSTTDGCGPIVGTVISQVGPDGFGATRLVEVAVAADLLASGADEDGLPEDLAIVGELDGLRGVFGPDDDDCRTEDVLEWTTGFVSGIASGPHGTWFATRAPFSLVEDADNVQDYQLPPRGDGFVGFHQAPAGIACASCHPDGSDDGHTWRFRGIGPRRTQALGGGILDTAPFHWDGDMADMDHLYAEVGVGRMGQEPAWGDQVERLGEFVDGLPTAPRGPTPDLAQARAGKELFSRSCASCHAPPLYTTSGWFDVGTGHAFQVPSLLGVAARLPVMHDGCADTLEARFTDPACGGGEAHGGLHDDAAEVKALVAFLETL